MRREYKRRRAAGATEFDRKVQRLPRETASGKFFRYENAERRPRKSRIPSAQHEKPGEFFANAQRPKSIFTCRGELCRDGRFVERERMKIHHVFEALFS